MQMTSEQHAAYLLDMAREEDRNKKEKKKQKEYERAQLAKLKPSTLKNRAKRMRKKNKGR